MHSSDLRSSDFEWSLDGKGSTHSSVFGDFPITRRVGIVCVEPLDGLGAATLILSSVTAFYDSYRSMGSEFFAYPDFYTFQLPGSAQSTGSGRANYSRFDIWPAHKNVATEPETLTDAITDRAVDTLILPEGWQGKGPLQPEQQATLVRTVREGLLYRPDGMIPAAELEIRCAQQPLTEWANMVIATVDPQDSPRWATVEEDHLLQSFRRLSANDTIARL